MKDGERGRS
jgi:hypothetical protein